MAIPTGYATIAEADATLGATEPWFSETDTAVKQSALDFGRLYLDTTYTCVFFDEDNPPDDVKDANSYLANAHLSGLLYPTETNTFAGPISAKSVKAGSVETSTTYSDKVVKRKADPSPEATAILAQGGTCVLKGGLNRDLIRG